MADKVYVGVSKENEKIGKSLVRKIKKSLAAKAPKPTTTTTPPPKK